MINCTVTCTLPGTPSLSRLFPPALVPLQRNCAKSHKCVNFSSDKRIFSTSLSSAQDLGWGTCRVKPLRTFMAPVSSSVLLHKEMSQLCHMADSVSCCRKAKETEFTFTTLSSRNKNICVLSVLIFSFPKSCLSQILGGQIVHS